ncbi:hypothetical protein GMLC_39310 [Geomonas limicola]|uniref:Uncharacterized protein n=1 Tax=Geomonas limicola TaxID=2740186 RepID=A0A6V8NCJ7_9BACT|nr:hypothetical protein [Geomonas limicola]GFO70352.1 hypothetical protein GMLC_39310 [Geomonas limicola]
MLVQVQWTNSMYDYVQDVLLDDLIEAGGVQRFLRSSGWATIGVDQIRSKTPATGYIGPERRGTWQPDPQAEATELQAHSFNHCGAC